MRVAWLKDDVVVRVFEYHGNDISRVRAPTFVTKISQLSDEQAGYVAIGWVTEDGGQTFVSGGDLGG